MASIDGALNATLRLLLPMAVLAAGALALVAVLDRLAVGERAAERRALMQREAELNASAMVPGSALSCLDGGAGEAIENACESAVFATPQSAAAAVAYTAARLSFLRDANDIAQRGEGAPPEAFAAVRRAVELDRYGIAAHVLATRDGCTLERCAAFALLRDTGTLKANLKAQAFDAYVSRYASTWNKSEPVAEKEPPASAPVARVPEPPAAPAGHPVSSKYDFPSAASIPPVSIMNAEPPLPKDAASAPPSQPAAEADVPVPPKRPQVQAVAPPAR
jgi:hypothetical protein